jgi:hypothetical protein
LARSKPSDRKQGGTAGDCLALVPVRGGSFYFLAEGFALNVQLATFQLAIIFMEVACHSKKCPRKWIIPNRNAGY